jgi:hypothetical protein
VLITCLIYVLNFTCWTVLLDDFYDIGWDWRFGAAYWALAASCITQMAAFLQGRYFTHKMLLFNDILNFADCDEMSLLDSISEDT